MAVQTKVKTLSEDIISIFEDISKKSTYTKEGECYIANDGLVYCVKCNTPLQTPVNIGGRILNMPTMCQCEQRLYNYRMDILAQQEHEVEVKRLRELGFSNQYYIDCTFAKDDQANPNISRLAHAYVEKFDRFYAKGLGILFQGSCGNGKTFISACIGNALIEREYSVYMTSISDIVNMMTKDYGNHRQEIVEKISDVDLLILDDLGTENILDNRKANTLELTYKVIDSRYISKKPMIVSTNLNIAYMLNNNDLSINLKRIFERILQMCKPYDLGSNNRRLAQSRVNNSDFNNILGSLDNAR